MAVDYTGVINVVCTTIEEFNQMLLDLQASITVSNIISDANNKTISFNITVNN